MVSVTWAVRKTIVSVAWAVAIIGAGTHMPSFLSGLFSSL
ncbi:MAG: hypothetical protein QOE56_1756 [Solirubrobacterales bacterium]|nr:hypothetical protein [Solirubrobacterales bacterium]